MAVNVRKDGGRLELDALNEQLNAAIADVTELRTQLIATLAKLDADAGVTDTDYESGLTPAAQTGETITLVSF